MNKVFIKTCSLKFIFNVNPISQTCEAVLGSKLKTCCLNEGEAVKVFPLTINCSKSGREANLPISPTYTIL